MAGRKKNNGGIVGLDVGGTKIDAILWREGRIEKAITVPTPQTERKFYSVLFELIGKFGGGIGGIGIGVAGPVESRSGKILGATRHIRFLRGKKLLQKLQAKFRVPVRVDNDAICFLRAELRFGQAKGKKNVVALTLGTGVGGGVFAEGNLLRGARGIAGHLGHIMIPGGEFEQLVGSYGFRAAGYPDPRKAPRRVYAQIGKHLGVALANFTNVFDPELFILGGGISKSHAMFLPAALKQRRRYALAAIGGHMGPVRVSRLAHAGALGAVCLFD